MCSMKCMPSLTFSYQENVLVYWIAAKIMQRLASNMISIINEAEFKDPEWNKKLLELTKKLH